MSPDVKLDVSSSKTRNFNAQKGWCAKRSDGQHWVQVDLGKILQITKIGTGGLKGKAGYVKSYSLSYSNNGQSWEAVRDGGKKKVPFLL